MTNNHVIDYLAIDLTGSMDLEKPQLRVPYAGPFWRGHKLQIQFTAGAPVDVEPPRTHFILDKESKPKAKELADYFARFNPRPIEVHHEHGTELISSYADWVEFCKEWPKGDLEQ